MVEYVILEDKVLVIDDSILDPNGNPTIIEITLEEYNEMVGGK
jgi:hypothetical protein